MINLSRTQLATGGTIVALGALTAVALGAQNSNSAATAQKTTMPEVRTVVVHRTIKVTKHRKPKKVSTGGSGGSAAAAGSGSGSSAGSGSYYSGTPSSTPVSSSPAPSTPKPVQTQTSGGGSYGGGGDDNESDHESGDDGEYEGGDD